MRGLSAAASMAPVEHVVADAGAFLRDAPLQVQEIPPRGAGPGLETALGVRVGSGECDNGAGLSAGHRKKHLHHPGGGQRDSGQGHAQAAGCAALRAAVQGALPGVREAG